MGRTGNDGAAGNIFIRRPILNICSTADPGCRIAMAAVRGEGSHQEGALQQGDDTR